MSIFGKIYLNKIISSRRCQYCSNILTKNIESDVQSWLSFGRAFTPGQTQTGQHIGRGFVLLLPQAAVLPGSDADSDGVEPVSNV